MLRGGGAGGREKHIRTIAMASGKGGVGKTNIVANLAIAMKKLGHEVLILDADLGLSNIDVLLHLAPKYNMQNVLNGEMGLADIIVEGPHGIKILPASSGVQELTVLDEFQRLRLLDEFESFNSNVDVMLIDTAAGISENVAFFCIAAQEIIILATPEPTAMTDAYALMKVLYTRYQEKEFSVLVNNVQGEEEGREVFKRLATAADKFLNVSLDYLGYIPYDAAVPAAVRQQRAFLEVNPAGKASKKVTDLAYKLMSRTKHRVKGSLQFFIGNLLSATSEENV
ncbi:MAG: MinD/ParA family protein [Nitrospirae bacterium]|nr:MinD/ParA family protein [Nitrospirota bacterium]MBF0535434.1 MinD/ParA family protein [Nitrospirota bacterium]MBF0617622.1 MinD/ParA family protein [Nitrospirota bacterium]